MSKLISDFFHGDLFKGDKGVWMIYFFLCMISLVEVYSASSRMTFNSESHWGPLISQAGFLLFGLVLILFIHRIPCKWFMLVPFILLPLSILLLVIAILGLGGGELNDSLFRHKLVNRVKAYIAPKIFGGKSFAVPA